MTGRTPFRVLIASDGSPVAKAAVKTALHFPWPSPSTASVVTAKFVRTEYRRSIVLAVLDRTAEAVAGDTIRSLAARWPDAGARVLKGTPADVIVGEARRTHADVVVMGWRGYGAVRRLLTGSVSRAVVRQSPCSVLVARRAVKTVHTILVGIDGSSHSLSAFDLVARLPANGRRVVLLQAVDTMHLPSQVHLTSSMRATIGAEVRRINRKRRAEADRSLQDMRAELRRRGWKASTVVTEGQPLSDLLAQIARSRADLLVIGARGATGLDRLLLGSVADGALNRSPVPVLIAK